MRQVPRNAPGPVAGRCGKCPRWLPRVCVRRRARAGACCAGDRFPGGSTGADDGAMETVTLPQVHRVGGLIGAELRGLDLTREYPDETYAAILRAWAEHGVIFLREQP